MAYTKAQREAKKAVAEAANVGEVPASPAPARKKLPKLDLNTMVKVKNGTAGMLVYVSRKTGYEFKLDGYGAEDYMDLGELLACRNSYPTFFSKNWFIIDDPAVCEFLKIGKFYDQSLDIDELKDVLKLDVDALVERVRALPEGQRSTLAYLAAQEIASGELDSRSRIEALENELGYQLTEG